MEVITFPTGNTKVQNLTKRNAHLSNGRGAYDKHAIYAYSYVCGNPTLLFKNKKI